jgi:hypothetical protein
MLTDAFAMPPTARLSIRLWGFKYLDLFFERSHSILNGFLFDFRSVLFEMKIPKTFVNQRKLMV